MKNARQFSQKPVNSRTITINVFGTDINLQQQSNILHITITATKAHFTGPACHMMKEDYNRVTKSTALKQLFLPLLSKSLKELKANEWAQHLEKLL